MVWEKLRRPHNSGWAYPVRPGNEVSCDKSKILLERILEGILWRDKDTSRSTFDPHSILLELLAQWHNEYERAWNNSGSTPTTKVTVPNVISTTRNDLSYITFFNHDKDSHYATKYPEPKREASKD